MNGRRIGLFALACFLLLAMLLVAACDSDDSPSAPTPPEHHVWVHHAGDSVQVFLNDLPASDLDGLDAVRLDALVSEDLVPPHVAQDMTSYDTRVLYAYLFVGEDGFSPHDRDYPSNTWDHLALGYILTATRDIVFPDALIDLPGAYNVRDTGSLHVRRKVDVVTADTTGFREIADLTVVSVQNAQGEFEDAVPLAACVEPFVDDPAAHVYHLTAIDGFGTTDAVTWTQLQTGYWLLVSQRTRFTDPDLGAGQYRLRMLERITVQ